MDGILGQDKAMETLRAQVASGRVHHAQIFHGPSGVGKFTAALRFARVLLGEDGWAGGDHPDLHVVTKELALYSDDAATRRRKLTSIPVEVVREHVLGPAFRSAQVSERKVFIIDEAELLNAAGQNALLKTLEEPPAGTTLILVTTSEDRLLPTIRSRCQRVAFVPLAEKHLSAYLDEREEAGAMSESERAWLLRFASGSLGRLVLALEYGLTGWARAVLGPVDGLVRGRASPGLGGVMQELQQGFAEAWVKRHDNASKEAANQTAGALMAAMLTDHARHHLGLLAAETEPDDPEGAEAKLGPWLGVIDAVEESRGLLGRNVNPSLVNDHLGVALHAVLGG
ncbi:MAG: DNA polymerase III subunit [Planctomycetota bacterium]